MLVKSAGILLGLLISFFVLFTRKQIPLFLADLLKKHPDLFKAILEHPQKNQVQILYTQIDRDKDNKNRISKVTVSIWMITGTFFRQVPSSCRQSFLHWRK